MYSYFYDAFLQDRKYEREMALLETRLTDLGIMGKITRLALFRDALEVIRDEIDEGAQTVVAVGDDNTFRQVIEAVGDTRTVIGYLPMGGKSTLADLLGIPAGTVACEILSARLVQDIDVGEVNGRRFLHAMECDVVEPRIACQDAYTLTFKGKVAVSLRNLSAPDDTGITDPSDERLTLVVRQSHFSFLGRKSEVSKFLIKSCQLSAHKPISVSLDGVEKLQGQTFEIQTIPGRLRLVTGKNRQF